MHKVLAFTISADFGYFKTLSSSTSPVTYGLIPKTAVAGLLGAIIGEFNNKNDKDNYLDALNNHTLKIAIEVLNPIKTTHFGLNYYNIKDIKKIDNKIIDDTIKKSTDSVVLIDDFFKQSNQFDRGNRFTQVNIEVLKKPSYRLFIDLKDRHLYQLLKERLSKNETYYHTFMGTTDFPLTISDFQELEITETYSNEFIPLDSVVIEKECQEIRYDFKNDGTLRFEQVIKETQPYQFVKTENGRKNKEFINLLYNSLGNKIHIKTEKHFTVKDNKEKAIMFY